LRFVPIIHLSSVPPAIGGLQIALGTDAAAQFAHNKRLATVDKIGPQLEPLVQGQMLDTWRGELWRRDQLIVHKTGEPDYHVTVLILAENQTRGHRPNFGQKYLLKLAAQSAQVDHATLHMIVEN
jgi:hypothetical protein